MKTSKSSLKADRARQPDALDHQILNTVRQDRRYWSPNEIAKQLKEPVRTIQNRVDRLRLEQRLEDVTLVDLSAAGFPLRYRIDIKINPRELREGKGGRPDLHEPKHQVSTQKGLAKYIVETLARSAAFKDRVIVEDVTIVLGDPADLCAVVQVKTHQDVFRFVTEGLRRLGGVESTSTSQEAWSVMVGDVSDYAQEESSQGAGRPDEPSTPAESAT